MKRYRIGFFQFQPVHRDPQANINRICAALSNVDADLLVLPELCTTGYLFASASELKQYAEPVPTGPTCQAIGRLSHERNVSIVFGLPELTPTGIYNSAVMVTPTDKTHVYRKTHLFWEEKQLFSRAVNRFSAIDIPGCRVGLLICFDYFFPEAARALALDRALVICHPANLVLDYAQSMTITRAAENRVFWVLANRIGAEKLGEKEMRFTGRSQIVDPTGRLLCRAEPDREELTVLEIDLDLAENKLVTPANHIFDDRRTDLY